MNDFQLFIDLLKTRPKMVLGNHRGEIDDMSGAIALFVGTLQMDRGRIYDVIEISKFMQWFPIRRPLGAESFIQWLLLIDQQNLDELMILEMFIQILESSKDQI